MKKVIAWVTAECFTETDYNLPVFVELCKRYEIHWYVINGRKPYLTDDKFDIFNNVQGLHIHKKAYLYRSRDIRGICFWYKLHKEIKKLKPYKTYYNMPPIPAYIVVTRQMDTDNTIFAAHDGKAQTDSDRFGFALTMCYNIYYRHVKYVNMFSETQTQLMHKTYPNVKVHTMVLPLKNFGSSKLQKPTEFIRFLSFGRIIYQKNIDLLIEAGNKLYERGYRNFRISINGKADNWSEYEKLIKYPEIFECNPTFITNEQLLDLYATSHYAVFPYRRVSQSGVLKLAFNYNVPVLVSRTGAFKEEVQEGVNGFFFEPTNLEDLIERMEMLMKQHDQYPELLVRMEQYIKSRYSTDCIVKYYIEMFDNLNSFQ